MKKVILATALLALSSSVFANKHENYVNLLIKEGYIKPEEKARTLCEMDALEKAFWDLAVKVKEQNSSKPKVDPLNPGDIIKHCKT